LNFSRISKDIQAEILSIGWHTIVKKEVIFKIPDFNILKSDI